MKVTLDGSVIADGCDRDAGIVSQFRAAGAGLVQFEAFLRGDHVSVFDRGNKQLTVSFTVSKIHADEGAAMLHAINHPASLPAAGAAIFELHGLGAVDGGTKHFTTCAIQATGNYMGCTTFVSYVLTGGELIDGAPA